MKYFIMSLDAVYTDVPRTVNWYDKINPKWVNREEAYRLPQAAVIFMVSYERCMILGSKVSEGGRTYYAKYQAQQDRCDRAEEYYKEYCGEDFD